MKVYLRDGILNLKLVKLNLSQSELAKKLKVSKGYISNLLNNRRYPSSKIRAKLQKLFLCSFDDLFIVEEQV